ncbi:MAG: TRAP transporter permease [Desulfomonile sp.]|nr:TRAP transporter permease [Desulfomonile sp.]
MATQHEQALKPDRALPTGLDRESSFRRLRRPWSWVVLAAGVGLAAFHVYTAATIPLAPQLQRSVHLGLGLGLVFLLYPARWKDVERGAPPWYDVVLALLGAVAGFYQVVFYQDLLARSGINTPMDYAVAGLAVILVLEATRRVAGWPMIAVAAAFLAYALWGNYLPGLFAHRGLSLQRVLEHSYLGLEGIMGIPLGVSATVIFVYLLFAQVLEKTGIRQFFVDVAMALTGTSPGGPAKAAVVSSAFEGTISGSSIANTAGSGSFTIPMMKKLGYRPEFAAAVEASASTGGQIMPPIMGAAAFVMVEFLNLSYFEIAKAAAIPAILYFTGVFLMVHFEALRQGLVGLPRNRLPKLKDVLLKQGYLILPLVLIFWLLESGFTAAKAAVWCMALAWILGMFRRRTRMGPLDILRTMEAGARAALPVIAACATAGIIVGVVTLTGIGLKLSANMMDLAGNSLVVALVFTMFASLVLGMGIPTTATYIVLATMAAPALVKLGVVPLAAHLFVFYFGVVADITPPVALAVYAGAAIAGSNPWKTGIESVKLATGAFLVPYIFALSPALVLVGATPLLVVQMLLTSVLGMVALGAGVAGFWSAGLRSVERFALIGGGLLLVDPGLITDLLGAGTVATVYLLQRGRPVRSAQ